MLKIGIIGGGIRGQLFARAIQCLEGVEVAGVADPVARTRETITRHLGIPTFASHEMLLDKCDGIIVATPDFAHLGVAVDTAEAGLPMLLEKPLTTSVVEAETLRACLQQHSVAAYVGFENRWANTFRQAKASIDAGQIGRVKTQFCRLSDSRSVPDTMLSWASQSSPGWFLMPHTVDLAVWLGGSRVRSVQARGVSGTLTSAGIDTLDAIFAILTMENGSLVSLDSNWSLPLSFPSVVDFRVDIVGSDGAITVDNLEQMLTVVTDRVDYPRTLGSEVAGRLQGPAAWMVQSFARKLQGHSEDLPSLEEGIHVTQVIEAIHKSIVSENTVDVRTEQPA